MGIRETTVACGVCGCYSSKSNWRDDVTVQELHLDQMTSAAALHVAAMRSAEGAGVPQDWGQALNLVQQSAQLGLRAAQMELAALAGEWSLAVSLEDGDAQLGPADCDRLRGSVNPAAWLAAPTKRIVSASPRIAVVDGLASPDICDWLIRRARSRLSRATVFDHDTGRPRKNDVRTNSQCHMLRDESDL